MQDIYLTSRFGLFSEKNLLPSLSECQGLWLVIFSIFEQNCLLLMNGCGKIILQVISTAMCVVHW